MRKRWVSWKNTFHLHPEQREVTCALRVRKIFPSKKRSKPIQFLPIPFLLEIIPHSYDLQVHHHHTEGLECWKFRGSTSWRLGWVGFPTEVTDPSALPKLDSKMYSVEKAGFSLEERMECTARDLCEKTIRAAMNSQEMMARAWQNHCVKWHFVVHESIRESNSPFVPPPETRPWQRKRTENGNWWAPLLSRLYFCWDLLGVTEGVPEARLSTHMPGVFTTAGWSAC